MRQAKRSICAWLEPRFRADTGYRDRTNRGVVVYFLTGGCVHDLGNERYPSRFAQLPALLETQIDPKKRRISRSAERRLREGQTARRRDYRSAGIEYDARSSPPISSKIIRQRRVRNVRAIEGARELAVVERPRRARERVREKPAEALVEIAVNEQLEAIRLSSCTRRQGIIQSPTGRVTPIAERVAHVVKRVVKYGGRSGGLFGQIDFYPGTRLDTRLEPALQIAWR